MNNNLPRERSRLTHLSHQLKVFYYENIYELKLLNQPIRLFLLHNFSLA